MFLWEEKTECIVRSVGSICLIRNIRKALRRI